MPWLALTKSEWCSLFRYVSASFKKICYFYLHTGSKCGSVLWQLAGCFVTLNILCLDCWMSNMYETRHKLYFNIPGNELQPCSQSCTIIPIMNKQWFSVHTSSLMIIMRLHADFLYVILSMGFQSTSIQGSVLSLDQSYWSLLCDQ